MSHMTQTANPVTLLASPLGEEGHEVAKGCTRVRMIMILLFYVSSPLKGKRLTTFCASLRSGGRRLVVRTAMEHPIGALPRTPFPASRDFPSRGNERYKGKNSESYTSCTISAFSPFGGWRHHLSAPLGRWCREAPKGGKSHRRWLIDVMLFKPYDTEK